MTNRAPLLIPSLLGCIVLAACGDPHDGSEADRVGVAAACAATSDCPSILAADGGTVQLICLPDFAGGYCGLPDCDSSADCPGGSICVRHTDDRTYCFRECRDKPECNRHRPRDVEANCSSSFDFNDPADDTGQKACIPPSSGL